ncbi:hypothetical protein OSB04_010319 [Centaurea solstitialis]|uniref:Lipoxygenase domain-containing protein n=1 Tax=Centaurea solstitialis TaxID=347529 RepID=A0AA38T7B6_9ASTR|nr:hypothetical protein OSB04_010319 [Centaurea solstitialis]
MGIQNLRISPANRPTIARTKMPDEDPTAEEWQAFIDNPENVLLNSFPTRAQATKVMAILDVLSTHSPDEEYIGTNIEAAWEADPVINAAFQEFNGRLKELEGIVDSRNLDPNLSNRSGSRAGAVSASEAVFGPRGDREGCSVQHFDLS